MKNSEWVSRVSEPVFDHLPVVGHFIVQLLFFVTIEEQQLVPMIDTCPRTDYTRPYDVQFSLRIIFLHQKKNCFFDSLKMWTKCVICLGILDDSGAT